MHEHSPVKELVGHVHAAPAQMVLAVTGGGSQAIADLLSVPGGSRSLLEAVVPYSAQALAEFLGGAPEQFSSGRTARAMAMAAFERARELQNAATPSPRHGESSTRPSPVEGEGAGAQAIGIGCTASLASVPPKRGTHRIHVALQTSRITATHSLELIKGRRDRVQEEGIAARMVLNTVAEGMGIGDRLLLPLLESEHVESIRTEACGDWQNLLLGRSDAVRHPSTQSASAPRAIFSGAFNPLHTAHLRMVEFAAKRLGAAVEFELSIKNVDKPPLDYTEMHERLAQFKDKGLPLWFTRAPTFEEKSRLFPRAMFVVGADTLLRIGQPKYYGNDPAAAETAFKKIGERGCRFLTFGRVVDGIPQSLADLQLPESLRQLCDEVPLAEFREDISSTALRQELANDE